MRSDQGGARRLSARIRRARTALTGGEWGRLALMYLFILAINAAGWIIYVGYVMPHHFNYQGEGGSAGLGVGLGVAVTAWFLGFRHAYETAGGPIGTTLSACFLYLIAVLNLIVLAGIFKVFREMRNGTYDEEELEAQLQARGLMYRFFGRFMRSINHTWQLYFVGLVFGIGFDTTTEVLLLAATAYAAIQGLPYFAVLALPFLFSGGMMLFDTLDGAFMNFAYGWAFARPVRKVSYNLAITALSIGAGLLIGPIEILGILTAEMHLHGAFWDLMANFNINGAGFCIAAMFVLVWAAALIYWRFGQVEARWSANVAADPVQPPGPSARPL